MEQRARSRAGIMTQDASRILATISQSERNAWAKITTDGVVIYPHSPVEHKYHYILVRKTPHRLARRGKNQRRKQTMLDFASLARTSSYFARNSSLMRSCCFVRTFEKTTQIRNFILTDRLERATHYEFNLSKYVLYLLSSENQKTRFQDRRASRGVI